MSAGKSRIHTCSTEKKKSLKRTIENEMFNKYWGRCNMLHIVGIMDKRVNIWHQFAMCMNMVLRDFFRESQKESTVCHFCVAKFQICFNISEWLRTLQMIATPFFIRKSIHYSAGCRIERKKWNRIKICDNLNTLEADRHISHLTQRKQQQHSWIRICIEVAMRCDLIDSKIDGQTSRWTNKSEAIRFLFNHPKSLYSKLFCRFSSSLMR